MKYYKLSKIYYIPAKSRREAEKILREAQAVIDTCIGFEEKLELIKKSEVPIGYE